LELARAAAAADIPVAAICIAPSILAHAGVLDGVRATAWTDRREDLEAHGAVWVDSAVVLGESATGSPVVTACGPSAAFAFGQALVGVLANG
jgi:protease I